MTITLHEKITAVEMLLDHFRGPGTDNHLMHEVLKAIAKDLRGRLNGAPSVTELELGRRINAVEASKAQKAGNLNQRLAALGQETISRWPVISQSLARFGALEEVERYRDICEEVER
jgi:hypothetical protein